MILSLFFLFLMILLITAAIFYLFCFFIPALKIKYEGITDSLATELHFTDDDIYYNVKKDFTKIAAIEDVSDYSEKRLDYKGEKNCRLFHEIYNSEYKSPKTCIGFGDCAKVCPQQAITIQNNRAHISPMCNGCGRCIDYCPENIISLIPREKKSDKDEEKVFKFWSACYKLIKGGMKVR
ncbi:MAG: 4Fe-4S binding protein [Treponema sp.]|nr:4Fe-4S binding protein [Treponema sp.]